MLGNGTTQPPPGTIIAGMPYAVYYDGTVFRLMDRKAQVGNFSVLEFGADSSGTNDSTAAIQAAINAAAVGCGAVLFPAGTYIVSIQSGLNYAIAEKACVTLQGAGQNASIIRLAASQPNYLGIFYAGTSGTTDISGWAMYDRTVDQNVSNNAITSSNVSSLSSYPRFIVQAYVGSNIHIQRCHFTNIDAVNAIALNVPSGKHLWLTDNVFDNIGTSTGVFYDHSTIYTSAADDVTIRGNHFNGAVSGGGGFGAYTAIEIHNGGTTVSDNVITDMMIGMNVAVTTSGANGVGLTVNNNVLKNVALGLDLWSVNVSESDSPIVNNTIYINRDPWYTSFGGTNTVSGVGIEFDPSSTTSFNRILISENSIYYSPTSQSLSTDNQSFGIGGVTTSQTPLNTSITISSNFVHGAYGAGIRIGMQMARLSITGNTIVDPGQSTNGFAAAYKSGMLFAGVWTDVQVRSNVLIDDQATTTMTYPIYSAVTASGSANLYVESNISRVAQSDLPIMTTGSSTAPWTLRHITSTWLQPGGSAYTAGSSVTVTSTGQTYAQQTALSGSTWALATPSISVINASTTGTTAYTLTSLTGAPSTAVITSAGATGGVIGISTAGAGTSGSVTIQQLGVVPCVFDRATVAGDYVQISSTTAGDCHDTGSLSYPTSGQVIGRVLSTNAAAGTYNMDLFPAEMRPPTSATTNAYTVGAALASAATVAPTSPIQHVTGTTQITTITAPVNFTASGMGGCVVLIPDGAWTTGTTGNIALASTATVSRALTMCYDSGTSKWYPSY